MGTDIHVKPRVTINVMIKMQKNKENEKLDSRPIYSL